MARVFSYIRFSSRKQLDGDSLRRQVESGDDWISRNGHSLAEIELHDLGRSGFHGQHLGPNGALSKFLSMIQTGRVREGDILLVENLDRLDRRGIRPAQDLFSEILDSGVLIATLKPYERVYDRKALEDPFTLLEPLMAFHLAFIESKKKSDRLKALWEQKRKEALEGIRFNVRKPAWLDDEGGEFRVNAGAEAIRFIFEQTAQGQGQRKVLGLLIEQFPAIGSSGDWNGSYIQKVLNDRAVLGHLQPKTNVDGRRVSIGPELTDYYPAIITEQLWLQAQSKKENNKKAKGPSGKFVNLFTGNVFNAVDGYAMHLQTTRHTKLNTYVQRRFVSYGHWRKKPNSNPLTVLYPELESHLLRHLTELNPEDLKSNVGTSQLRAKQLELEGVNQRIKRIETDLAEAPEDEYETLKNAARIARKNRDELKEVVEKIQTELSADQPLLHVHDILKALNEVEGEELRTLRLRLRSLISELVESIYMKPEKHLGRIYLMVQVNYKAGVIRQFGYGPGWVTTSSKRITCRSHLLFNYDLREKEACQNDRLEGIVKLIHRPADKPEYKTVPKALAEAGELFIAIRKSEMAKESYKTLPSKVRRFTAYTGGRTRDVTAKDLNLYKRLLGSQVREGKIKRSQARVELNRVKEFLRWLIDQEAIGEFDTSESAAKAIS